MILHCTTLTFLRCIAEYYHLIFYLCSFSCVIHIVDLTRSCKPLVFAFIISKCRWFRTNSSSLTWSCTPFKVDILCIVLLQVRVFRFSGQLSCTVTCLLMMSNVSTEAAWVNSRFTAALVVFYSQLLKPFTCVVLRHWLLHNSTKSLF